MKVAKILYTLQGESSYAGLLCVLVRLAGCNLSCSWCDTPSAREGGEEISLARIMAEVKGYNCRLVEITGGEPLLQEETPTLCQRLSDDGRKVLVETNGSLDISVLPPGVIRIMDLKCPGSSMTDRMRWENLKYLTSQDELKLVISDREDYEWAKTMLAQYQPKAQVLMGTVWGKLEPQQLAQWLLEDNFPCRFQLQLHKIIGVQ